MLRVLKYPNNGRGKHHDHSNHSDARFPTSERVQRMQDVLLVSSFGLWAVLLGLTPVLAFRLLVGS